MRAKTTLLIILLAALHLTILFAGFVAPYDPTVQNRDLPMLRPLICTSGTPRAFTCARLYMA